MKIGIYFGRFISSDPTVGGAFTFQESIFSALKNVKSVHEFYIFSDDCKTCLKQDNIKFIQLKRYFSNLNENFVTKFLLKIPRKLKKIELRKKFKTPLNKAVLDNKIDLMWFATPAYEFVEVPFIYTVWDLEHRLQSFFPEVSVTGWKYEDREIRYNFVIPRAAYILIGNQEGKEEVVKFYGVPEDRVKTLSLPTPDFVFNSYQKKIDVIKKYKLISNYLFYPAQFWPHKNHIIILLALKILKEKYNLDFTIVFTGSDKGNLRYIKKKTEELGLKDKVYFLGFVPIQELMELYKNAFALIFASLFGPDNIPPLEAFALNCPVIASNISGAKYQLKNSAILFSPKNEYDLANKIKELYENKELRKQLVEDGYKLARSWTSKNYLKGVLDIIDEFSLVRRCWSSEVIYRE